MLKGFFNNCILKASPALLSGRCVRYYSSTASSGTTTAMRKPKPPVIIDPEFHKLDMTQCGPQRPAKPIVTSAGNLLDGVRRVMELHSDAVVLTEVGSFYEMYLEQAVEVGPKLNLKVARKRSKKDERGYVAMAGFPSYQLERYLKILVNDMNRKVAIVNQVENANELEEEEEDEYDEDDDEDSREAAIMIQQGERYFTDSDIVRMVTRVVTPGTLISESFIDSSRSNFLLSVVFTNNHLSKAKPDNHESDLYIEESPVGLAWLDLSVGTFYYQTTMVKDLMSDIARLRPKEILLDSSIRRFSLEEGNWCSDLSELKRYLVNYQPFPSKDTFGLRYAGVFDDSTSASMKFDADRETDHKELSAINSILSYVSDNLPGATLKLKTPQRQSSSSVMRMDSRSIDALELFQTLSGDSVRGSLFSTIKRTVTPSGARLLNNWLSSPSTSLEEISRRQDYVQYFMENPRIRSTIADMVRDVDDCVRIIQKCSLRKNTADDLWVMANSIFAIKLIAHTLHNEKKMMMKHEEKKIFVLNQSLLKLDKCLKGPMTFAKMVKDSIDENALIIALKRQEEEVETEEETNDRYIAPKIINKNGLEDKGIIRKDATPAMADYNKKLEDYDRRKRELEQQLADEYGHNGRVKIMLKWSPALAYHINVQIPISMSFTEIQQIPGVIIQQFKNRQNIHHKDWSLLGQEREYLLKKRTKLEAKILRRLRRKLLRNTTNIRSTCETIDELDVTSSFATLALEQRLVRPQINNGNGTNIVQGRHMTVETGLKLRGSNFIANDCHLNHSNSNSLWVITGPNMGGKSTFMRQVAIITILSQIGCFVPAQQAEIGIADRIFCRVGAADDLYRDRSTFMVEMLETSYILKNATPKSLAILDEVGRGTSSKDGLAIAYAVITHLTETNKCRTLFATHYGRELFQVLKQNDKHKHNLDFYYTDLNIHRQAYDEVLDFNYTLQKGISPESHGIHIASLAGFPLKALQTARDTKQALLAY